MVEHGGGVNHGVKSKFLANFLFCYVGADHLDEGAPCALDEAVGGLVARIGDNHLAFVGVNPSKFLASNELVVKVGVKFCR